MWEIYAFYCNIEDIYGVWATGNMPFIVESGGYIWAVVGGGRSCNIWVSGGSLGEQGC